MLVRTLIIHRQSSEHNPHGIISNKKVGRILIVHPSDGIQLLEAGRVTMGWLSLTLCEIIVFSSPVECLSFSVSATTMYNMGRLRVKHGQ